MKCSTPAAHDRRQVAYIISTDRRGVRHACLFRHRASDAEKVVRKLVRQWLRGQYPRMSESKLVPFCRDIMATAGQTTG